MNALQKRFALKLGRYGEMLTLNGTTPVRAFVQDLLSSQISTYVDSYDQATVTRPGLYAVVAGDASVSVGDTSVWDGRTYEVRKVSKQRVAQQVIYQSVVLW